MTAGHVQVGSQDADQVWWQLLGGFHAWQEMVQLVQQGLTNILKQGILAIVVDPFVISCSLS